MRSARAKYQRYQVRRGVLSVATMRVLQALSYGGMLTEAQVKVAAGVTAWRTRQSLAELTRRGLVTSGARPGRFEITCSGHRALTGQVSGVARPGEGR